MKNLNGLATFCASALALFLAADCSAAPPSPPAEPVRIQHAVEPTEVAAGEQTRLLVHLAPIDGVKVNRYPKIRLEVDERSGLVGPARTEVGNDKAPPPGEMETNYFKNLDPLELTLAIDPQARPGTHELEAKLTYFYCVTESGFCAPKSVPVRFAVRVR